ncbi:tape-measure protein [Streptomyces sp. NPDC001034]|uniref:tape-measure protein n=1 Tax=Streptomyces sp. NPDC001034 TaxID=3154375 RepID=UPI003333F1FD
MSAAASSVTDLFQGVPAALRTFGQRTDRTSGAVSSLVARIKGAAGAVERVRPALTRSATAVSRMRESTEAASRSAARAGQTATTSTAAVTSFAGRARTTARSVGKLTTGLGGVLTLVAGLIDFSGPLGGLMDKFGTAMTIGSGIMLAVNLITRANPVGFLTGILLPVAGWLLDLAMNSETGQKLMEQLATLVLKYVESVLTVLVPVLKVVATVVGTYLKGYLTVIRGVLTVLGALVGTGFAVLKALTTGDTRALGGRVSAVWHGLKDVVRPVLDWITKDVPRMFQRVKDAVTGTLRGMGQFVTTGAQTVAGVVKGPIQGLVAFANWVIDGLNHLSFSFFGKKFGVHLDKIPMLAQGGVVVPGTHARAGRVLPLTTLDRRRALAARHRTTAQARYRVKEFHESHGAGAYGTAQDLLFLASAHACS